ncbi:hypothetical protein [Methylobacterium sp. GC_Met_2]|uniref:hypothetical protein n=1 Tax=Methylobacterium sp. GC_Met_2 TaxID=2937376 RepID=UPI00226B79F9|nr:hypothetical protein [Methylobacterium sp. GC_Met_2]
MAGKPDFNLMVPLEYDKGDGTKGTRWVRFGAVWENKDGTGFSGRVDFWPVGATDRVVMMPPKDSKGADDE